MRMTVITDAAGNIQGTAVIAPRKDKEAPETAVLPLEGQFAHEIEVDDELAELPAERLHLNYRVEKGRLVDCS